MFAWPTNRRVLCGQQSELDAGAQFAHVFWAQCLAAAVLVNFFARLDGATKLSPPAWIQLNGFG